MSREISALVFDAYGTLFDVHSVTRLGESFYPGKGAALSASWRAKQLEYTWLRSLMGRYEDFSRVTLSALEWTFENLGIEPAEAERRALLDEYRRLAMFPEVAAALEELAARRPLAILSNGHPEMLDAVVAHNGLSERFRGGVISVHSAKIFKPAPSVYRLVEDQLGVPRTLMGANGFRLVERMGCGGRQDLRFPDLLDQSRGRSGGAAGGSAGRRLFQPCRPRGSAERLKPETQRHRGKATECSCLFLGARIIQCVFLCGSLFLCASVFPALARAQRATPGKPLRVSSRSRAKPRSGSAPLRAPAA